MPELKGSVKTSTDPPPLFSRFVSFGKHQIRRPLYFYVGLNKHGRAPIEHLIRQNGGVTVSEAHSALHRVISLIDPLSKPSPHGPQAYSVDFVTKCIMAGKLLDIDSFRIRHCNDPPRNAQRSRSPSLKSTPVKQANGTQSPRTPNRSKSQSRPSAEDKKNDARQDSHHKPPSSEPCNPPQLLPTSDSGEPQERDEIKPVVDTRAAIERAVKHSERRDRGSSIVLEEISPPADTEQWTPDEDQKLRQICDALQTKLEEQQKDLNHMFLLNTWKAMGNSNVLPPDRTIEECRERALYLRISKKEHDKPAVDKERRQTKPARRRSEEIQDDEIQPDRKERRATKVRRVLKLDREGAAKTRNKAKVNTRQPQREDLIRRLVRSLSYETQMTQRRVFQVLRANSGDPVTTKAVLERERRQSEKARRLRRSKT